MNPVYIILIAIFILIFLATAILTICALPGWIKVPDNYLKILFSSLLLEVIACVFLVFNLVRPSDHKCEDKLKHKAGDNWVLLNEKGEIHSLMLNDSLISADFNAFSLKASELAKFDLVKEECKDGLKYFIKKDSICLGRLYDKTLSDLNLFNALDLKTPEFKSIKYVKNDNGQWIIKGTLDEKWSLRINVSGSTYTISDTNTAIYNEFVPGFDKVEKNDKRKEGRKLHSFKGSDGAFYIIHISSADNLNTDKQLHHVEFSIIRTPIDTKLH